MLSFAHQWSALIHAGELDEAIYQAVTLSTSALDDLTQDLLGQSLAGATDAFDVAAAYCLAHAPALSYAALSWLTEFVELDQPLYDNAITMLMQHPRADEGLAQQLLWWSPSSHTANVISRLGWWSQTALALVNQQGWKSDGRARDAYLKRMNSMLAKLQEKLNGYPPQVAEVVRALGPSWVGTVNSLVETACGIVA